jgi:hypothetical protein
LSCPICSSDKMELLPTSSPESCGIDQGEFRRTALQFWTEIEGVNPT